MKYDMFRYFLRKNFESIVNNESNEDIDILGLQFNEYLKENLSDEVINRIVPNNIAKLLIESNHPLKQNGFNPALFIHFTNFIKESYIKSLNK